MIPNREDSIVFTLGYYVHGITARPVHADESQVFKKSLNNMGKNIFYQGSHY